MHLTCCVARRSSCQLLLPSETGKGDYVRKRAGLMISFIMPSEPGRINVAERTSVTEHRLLHCWGPYLMSDSNKARVKKVLSLFSR